MTIGEKIRIRRKELGLTTTELGHMIGVQNSAISKYEKGKIELKASQIKAIAEVLQINPVLLLDDDVDPNLSLEERSLIAAYRASDPSARKFALQILENNRL